MEVDGISDMVIYLCLLSLSTGLLTLSDSTYTVQTSLHVIVHILKWKLIEVYLFYSTCVYVLYIRDRSWVLIKLLIKDKTIKLMSKWILIIFKYVYF